MIATIVAGTIGLVVGLAIGIAATRHRLGKLRCPVPEAHLLTDDDREQITAEFAAHSIAANRALSQFADELAGDDLELRNRLRRFEAGQQP